MTDERNPQDHARDLAEKLYASIPRPAFDPKLSKELAEYLGRELVKNTTIKTFTALIAAHTASQLAGAVRVESEWWHKKFHWAIGIPCDGTMEECERVGKIANQETEGEVVSEATDKQLEEVLPCNMRCSPGITHSIHCFAVRRSAVRALADALIAGAYLACADNCRVRALSEMIMRDEARRCGDLELSKAHGDRAAVLQDQERAIPALLPDAASLALEELRQERDVAREANEIGPCGKHPLSCYTADEKIISVGRGVTTKGYCTVCAEFAEREAKLIADTRDSALDEAAEALSRVQHVAGNVKLILSLKGQGGASRDDS